MGLILWLVCGFAAFFLARIVPVGRSDAWGVELVAALVTAVLMGALATLFDFGGWREPDWRAGLFAFLDAVAVVGALRAIRH